MRSIILFLALTLKMLFFVDIAVANGLEVIDDSGAVVKLAKSAQRIVTLAPHAAEMLFAIDAGDKIVGAVDYTDYPEKAKRIPRVGGYSRIDLEAVVVLKPDLVVAWQSGNSGVVLSKLKKLGLAVYITEPRKLEDIASNMARLGRLVGQNEASAKAAADFTKKLNRIKQRYTNRVPLRVFYQIWNKPLMTINGEHLIGKVIELCGGENIFSDLPTLAPQVDLEAILLINPQVIVASGMAASRPEWLQEWNQWPDLSAVKSNSVYTINPDIIQRHSPRILDGASEMCEHLENTRRKLGYDDKPR